MIYSRIRIVTTDGAEIRQGVCSAEAIGIAILTEVAPELVGGGIALLGVGAATVSYASIVGYTAVAAAGYGLSFAASRLLTQGGQSAQSPQKSQINIKQPLPDRFRSYGTAKVGGPIAFERVDYGGQGKDANLANACYIVLLQGQGQIDSILEHWLDDRQVLIDGSNIVSAHIGEGSFPPIVKIFNKLGTASQAAFSLLTSTFDYITDNHRWRGVPVSLVTFYNYTVTPGHETTVIAQQAYPSGPWKYRAVQRAALLYDPRDGAQNANGDPDDPSSANWAWSDNAALVILDFLRHPDGWGRRANRAMLPISRFRIADWIAFANSCDVSVNVKVSGAVKRYRISGSYQMTVAPKQILQGMLDACDAEIYRHSDGTIGIRGGKWDDPTVTITDADIIGHQLTSLKGKASASNIIKAKYNSPGHDYQEVDMDPLYDQANIDLRGEELPVDLDLAWCPSHNQARRLTKIQLAKRNPVWFGTIVTGPRGLLVYNQRIITLQINELGIDDTFFITSFKPSPSFEKIEIGISSLASSAYDFDPDNDEGTPAAFSVLDGTDVSRRTAPTSIPIPGSLLTSFADNGGVLLTWNVTNPNGWTLNYEARYQETSPAVGDFAPMRVSEVARAARSEIILPGADYQFQVRALSPAGQPSAWATAVGLPFSLDYSRGQNSGYLLLLMV